MRMAVGWRLAKRGTPLYCIHAPHPLFAAQHSKKAADRVRNQDRLPTRLTGPLPPPPLLYSPAARAASHLLAWIEGKGSSCDQGCGCLSHKQRRQPRGQSARQSLSQDGAAHRQRRRRSTSQQDHAHAPLAAVLHQPFQALPGFVQGISAGDCRSPLVCTRPARLMALRNQRSAGATTTLHAMHLVQSGRDQQKSAWAQAHVGAQEGLLDQLQGELYMQGRGSWLRTRPPPFGHTPFIRRIQDFSQVDSRSAHVTKVWFEAKAYVSCVLSSPKLLLYVCNTMRGPPSTPGPWTATCSMHDTACRPYAQSVWASPSRIFRMPYPVCRIPVCVTLAGIGVGEGGCMTRVKHHLTAAPPPRGWDRGGSAAGCVCCSAKIANSVRHQLVRPLGACSPAPSCASPFSP